MIYYLIKQNDNYISTKSEFYKQLGQPKDDTQLQDWFKKYGTDDLSVLTKRQDKNTDLGIDRGNIGSGKYFSIDFPNDFLSISRVE
ncbi:hypothetical protein HBE96_06665 [Clostridium sp. P21]|uniref:Uncharacterized protein n=1 Tax=Clostridium muellerianum TaxID=2716538 RepID=A0A7Y0EF51_9CLOT|nr:hypothetical protein [Clostridium muellerianum]NMM62374.1 hypothetical protein [Clostridium muellerianum]